MLLKAAYSFIIIIIFGLFYSIKGSLAYQCYPEHVEGSEKDTWAMIFERW